MDQASGTKRVTVVFSDEQFEALQRTAREQGITVAAALRQAIELSSLITKAKSENTEILFKRGDTIQELQLAS